MAQGRSDEIISMFKWIRTSRLSINNFFILMALWEIHMTPGNLDVNGDSDRMLVLRKCDMVSGFGCAAGGSVPLWILRVV